MKKRRTILFKIPQKTKHKQKRTSHDCFPRPLMFKLQQKV